MKNHDIFITEKNPFKSNWIDLSNDMLSVKSKNKTSRISNIQSSAIGMDGQMVLWLFQFSFAPLTRKNKGKVQFSFKQNNKHEFVLVTPRNLLERFNDLLLGTSRHLKKLKKWIKKLLSVEDDKVNCYLVHDSSVDIKRQCTCAHQLYVLLTLWFLK